MCRKKREYPKEYLDYAATIGKVRLLSDEEKLKALLIHLQDIAESHKHKNNIDEAKENITRGFQ